MADLVRLGLLAPAALATLRAHVARNERDPAIRAERQAEDDRDAARERVRRSRQEALRSRRGKDRP